MNRFIPPASIPAKALAGALALCGALLTGGVPTPAAAVQQLVPGHVPPIVHRLQAIGQLPASQELRLALGLPLRNRSTLTNLLHDLYDPTSPSYHKFITPEEFARNFGPTAADYQAVAAFAQSHHLQVVGTHPNRVLLDVQGSVADIEAAFHVTLHVYRHPTEARTFYAPDTEPWLDASVPIQTVSGLNDYVLPHPNFVRQSFKQSGAIPQLGSGPGGAYMGNDFRAAYVPGTTLTGAGQVVGLLQFDGYYPNDIFQYEALAGLPNVPLVNVYVDNYNGVPGPANTEVALDIEMCASMAPGLSEIIVYSAGPNGIPEDVMNRMATDNLARQLSASWGWGGGPRNTIDQISQQMIAQGQSFFHSSGDSDAYPTNAVDDPMQPNAPADSPYMTQVGGTTLSTSGPGGAWSSETVWNWFNDVGSSGGISSYYGLPSWQAGIDMTANGGSTTNRNLPDVALTGDNVFVIADNGVGQAVGGTSVASPLWAAFTSLVNQQAAFSGDPPVGFINPAVYAIAKSPNYGAAFHDIITGNNTNSVSTNAFFAVPGYDLCTGWGTPAGTNLINLLAPPSATPIPTLAVFGNTITGGNGNGIADTNECDQLFLVLTNNGVIGISNIQVTLFTATAGVVLPQSVSSYPDLPAGASSTNLNPFSLSLAPDFVCGTPIRLFLLVKSDQANLLVLYNLPTGRPGFPLRYNNSNPTFIPGTGQASSSIVVSNLDFAVTKVTVSAYINDNFDAGLTLHLVAPDGSRVLLANQLGGNGQNYGLACGDDSLRTTFDDDATNSILAGVAPFLGSYRPEQRLANFTGKYGTNLNGAWRLVVDSNVPGSSGAIQCWSLFLTPSYCIDGGGECPGADLSLTMSAQPEPALVGGTLTYTINVRNGGPSSAQTVSVSQVLPANTVLVSATASQGSCAQNGNLMSASLGRMAPGRSATVTVVVRPLAPGIVSSSATVSSEQPDFNLANNSATVFSHINPPNADISVGLLPAPASLVIGGSVTYTVSVTNNGPSVASSVTATNVFPPGLILTSEMISQGSLTVNGNTVVCSFGGLANGARATATISAIPVAAGTFVATTTAGFGADTTTIDPILANNSASATISVGPAADVGIGLVAFPNPIVLSSNLSVLTSVTNFGPSIASSVVASQTLPLGSSLLTNIPSQGSVTLSGTNVIWNIGNLAPGARATLATVLTTTKLGTLSSSANVAAVETDPNLANNSAAVQIAVAQPFISIGAAGAALTMESFSPPNGAIDVGETVTLQLRLQNAGNIANTNLVARLLATGGVNPAPNSVQTYGVLEPIGVPGGVAVSRPFTFVATGTNGGTVVATLQLTDGTSALPPVSFSFGLPTISSFTNNGPIDIPNSSYTLGSGPADPYPSTNFVSGVTGQVSKVTATLLGFTHSYPHDVNILLVPPQGTGALLMSHAADVSSVSGATLTFDDLAAAAIPAVGSISSGTFQPSDYSPAAVFPAPAPPAPYANRLSTFNGVTPNGVWSLYVYDDSDGDVGVLSGGWALNVVGVSPVNQVADLGLSVSTAPLPVVAGSLLTYTFTVTNAGPDNATGVTFSNALPANVSLVSATSSQGNVLTNGNLVLGNLATLAPGSNATVTVTVLPAPAAQSLTNFATVASFETDLHSANNSATVVSTVGLPTADVALAMSVSSANLILSSNLTYTLSLTNQGPGAALGVVLTDPLPPGSAFVAATASPGSATLNQGALVATVGDLQPGATATVTLTVAAVAPGWLTNTASASTVSADPVLANNTASSVVSASVPAPILVAAGATMTYEGFSPPDLSIDPGETVTLSLGIVNRGVLDTANLVATLLPTGGVTAPSAPATYGSVRAGGAPVARSFTFTADPAATGNLVATLQLQDGAENLGTITFSFPLPATNTFSSVAPINIPDHGPGSPYPSTLLVSGLTGYVSKAVITLNGLSHSFPSDVSILLANPAGADSLLMSHNGGPYSITNVNLTFDDAAANYLPGDARISTGRYRPSSFGTPVIFPPLAPAAPYGATLAALNQTSPNGLWSLYVLDDSPGDSGALNAGWTLTLTTVTPVNPVADLAVSMSSNATNFLLGDTVAYSVTLTNLGPSDAPGVVLVDVLPQGFSLVSNYASLGTISLTPTNLTCSIANLPVNGSASLVVTAKPGSTGTFVNFVSVSGGFNDLVPGNNFAQATTDVSAAMPASLTGMINSGVFQLTLTGVAGQTYVIEASTDLVHWTPVSTNTAAADGVIYFLDPNSPSIATRFYRSVRLIP